MNLVLLDRIAGIRSKHVHSVPSLARPMPFGRLRRSFVGSALGVKCYQPTNHLTDEDFYDKPEDLALKDEVTEYLRMPLLPVDDPLDWWRRHQTSLPKLARMNGL